MDRKTFEGILKDGWPAILSWKEEEKEETLYFECKSKEDPETYKLSPKDQGEIAVAVCALANTSGGVLAFGVHAKNFSAGMPDKVQNIRPIREVEKTKELIDKILYELTDPPVVGIEAYTIINQNMDGAGVVLIWIPRNEAGPCQTTIGPDIYKNKYFSRFGTSTSFRKSLRADRMDRADQMVPPDRMDSLTSREVLCDDIKQPQVLPGTNQKLS